MQQQSKKLPHDPRAERALLGAILLSPDRLPIASAMVSPKAFMHVAHEAIFLAILAVDKAQKPIDPVTVSAELGRAGNMGKLEGGPLYLVGLLDDVPSTEHIEAYAKAVADAYALRRIIRAAGTIAEHALEGETPEALLELAQRAFAELVGVSMQQRAMRSLDAVVGTIDAIDQAKRGKSQIIPTGFSALDRIIGGFRPKRLYVVAGRPSMGKTALALTMAVNVARRAMPVLFFSLEMGWEEIGERLIAADAKVDLFDLASGKLSDEQWRHICLASPSAQQRTELFIAEYTAPTVAQITAESIRWAAAHVRHPGQGLILVDYVQLARGSSKRQDQREAEVAEISRGMKNLSRIVGLPVVALSQLNRGLESRQDKRPMLSDLRESGAIEQDADCVIFVYRDEVYTGDKCERPGTAELIVGKHRQGKTDTALVGFAGKQTRFYNLASPWRTGNGEAYSDYGDRAAP